MNSMPAPLPTPAAQCIPFAQATPQQIYQARDTTKRALGATFVPLPRTTWINVFETLQPDLWVAPDTVYLAAPDVARVARHLDSLPAVMSARAGQGPPKRYYTRQPVNCPDEVLRALAELEATPHACGPAVYALAAGVIRHHAEVEKFQWATVPDPREDDGTDPDQARAALLARVAALDRARREPGAA